MNEKPEGTPNPLNPNPEVAPVTPEPVAEEPAPLQPAVAQPATQPAPTQPATAQQAMAQPAVAKPKKAGLIIAIILCVVAIVAGVAAALLFINPFAAKKDAVPAAIAKLMSNDAPRLVAIDGNITLVSKDDTSPVSEINVKFQSSINGVHSENYANVVITATFSSGGKFTFNADEVGTSNGDLYLKLSNIAEALQNYEPLAEDATNCVDGPEGTNCGGTSYLDCDEIDEDDCVEAIVPTSDDSVLDFLGVFEVIDDEWIKISSSDFSNVTGIVSLDDMPTQCLIDAAGKMSKYSSDFATLYNQNPFINYSTDDLKISQKKDDLYHLKFDAEKMAGFINSMSNSGFMNEMLACMDEVAVNEEVSAEDLQEIISVLPDIYVEIDGSDNFTRVYLTLTSEDGAMTVTADLSFSYPSQITIQEPEVYIDMNEVLRRLLTKFYGVDIENPDDMILPL